MATKFELNSTTPAPPAGKVNIVWQSDAAGNISGHTAGVVASVFGRTGAVVAQSGDYAVAQVTGAVPDTRTIIAGTGLSGGGALSGNVTLSANIAGIQTPWLSNIDTAGYSLTAGGQVRQSFAGNFIGFPDPTNGVAQGTKYGQVQITTRGDNAAVGSAICFARFGNLNIGLGYQYNDAAIFGFGLGKTGADFTPNVLSMNAYPGLERVAVGGALTVALDATITGDLYIGNTTPASAVTMRLDGYNDSLQIFTFGGGGGRIVMGTSGAERLTFEAAGAIKMWLGGSLKTLSVDGSGFVKAA